MKRFDVVMQCAWNGDEGVLMRPFLTPTAARKSALALTALPGGRFTGRADDVVGVAQGQARGNAFHWTYTLALPVDGRVYEVQFDSMDVPDGRWRDAQQGDDAQVWHLPG